ncbi:MAG: bifunctional phosphopantothenoylcysteine decarboxylase/phosphopantothenate--cysteine ligase CoaBC [Syntrophomonadaceae bacterium]|jgi:phosphopantothenoylcysteine decarboxylase/phosphopantothenate--cysteine ligase
MPKTIGIGLTGGIAAYKIADLVSRLKKEDFEVIVMMTDGAKQFIAPLTLEVLSGKQVMDSLWNGLSPGMVKHIAIAEQIDLLVVAPATANFIAKAAHGIADDLLTTVFVANTAPVLIVPAMNNNMYSNRIVQDNLQKLKNHGCHILEPESGSLACGTEGKGRLPDIDIILEKIKDLLSPQKDLEGKTLMVNAGSTCEDIDPVRFITNRGTGRMGYAIAAEAVKRGADVILVSGKSSLLPPPGVQLVNVWSAEEMYNAMLQYLPDCDIIIGAAAVGDFKVAQVAEQKIKKSGDSSQRLVLELVSTPDILKELGQRRKPGQILVGFAAETENLIENAKQKLQKKSLDFIVANNVTEDGAGFAGDTNIVTIIDRNGECISLPKMSKSEVARAIIDKIVSLVRIQ